ncbi:hypothetical protein ACHAWF_013482 [Thalassiosira exigua]
MDSRRLSISKDVLRRRFSVDSRSRSGSGRSGGDAAASSESVALTGASAGGGRDDPTPYGSGAAPPSVGLDGIDVDDGGGDDDGRPRPSSAAEERRLLKDEAAATIRLALPVVATSLLEMFPPIAVTILVGRADYGDDEYDDEYDYDGRRWLQHGAGGGGGDLASKSALYMTSASLATMFVNIVACSTGLGLGFVSFPPRLGGLLGAMDTLCSAAHGAGQHAKMGTYLLTGTAVLSVLTVLVAWIVFRTEDILLRLDQPAEVCRHAARFALWYLPGIPFLYAFELLRKVSQARGEVYPMMLAASISNVVNVGAGYYLVNRTSWGWLGAAWALSLGRIVALPCMIFGMARCGDEIPVDDDDEEDYKHLFSHLWEGFDPKLALDAKAVTTWLGLGVPGMLQLMFEWVAWEVVALLCGILQDEKRAILAIGASAIGNSVSGLTFMAYQGTSVAGNIRIGGALGAGDARRARTASRLAMALGGCLSAVNMIVIFSLRNKLPYLFNTDPELVAKSSQLFLVAAIYQLPDAINCVGQGVFQASGRQALGAKLNFVAYYLLGLPCAYFLGIVMDFGVEGFWWGMTLGLFVIATANAIVVLKSDWESLSLQARKRLSLKPVPGNEA